MNVSSFWSILFFNCIISKNVEDTFALNTSVSDPASKQTSVEDIKHTLKHSKCNNFES